MFKIPAMKKLLSLSLIAILGAATVRADDSHTPRTELVVRVETCEAIIREFMANPATAIPRGVLQNARGIMILSQFKAGFIFGVKGGYGVLMVKKPNGRWSLPVLIDASEASPSRTKAQISVPLKSAISASTDAKFPATRNV